ncbi:MAG TPA: PP0621 family protein [Noviherbaspirillum sp.]|jgi:uncharacterized protein|nr:PP0621 family protein [Noviherbaspirillum sp.]
MKLLLWALIGVVVVMWLTRSKKPVSGGISGSDNGKAVTTARDMEPMVQCRHCGVHVPSSESVVSSSGAVFCSEEHRLQHVSS